MKEPIQLIMIKATHTIIWCIMCIAIFYTIYAGIMNKIDIYLWISVGLIIGEITALALNNWVCPLTSMAKKYLEEWDLGDDIYLPRWIARYNREIFTPPLVLGLVIVIFRLIKI